MILRNREEAAEKLAKILKPYDGQHPLILTIPRGSVGMGRIIADALGGELDIVLVHKLGHNLNHEVAIGAVDEDGQVYMEEDAPLEEIPIKYLESERQAQWHNLKNQRQLYTPVHSSLDPKGRIVIIVDDGIATGWTLRAAIIATRERKPQKIIAAIGVSSAQAKQEIESLADEVICLITPADFMAVSQFYQEFEQVSDEEVVRLLAQAASSEQ